EYPHLIKMRQIPAYSASTLSDTRQGKRKRQANIPLVELLESYIHYLGYSWDEAQNSFQLNNETSEADSSSAETTAMPHNFTNVEGSYTVYHLSHKGTFVFKNILKLDKLGNVYIEAQYDTVFTGKAHFFGYGYLAFNITTCIKKEISTPFYFQILANLGAYRDVAPVSHFVAVSTTVTIAGEPMLNKRVFVKNNPRTKVEPKAFDLSLPKVQEEIDKDSALPGLAQFLIQGSSLESPHSVNEPLSRHHELLNQNKTLNTSHKTV
ncbi:MAG: hypothetical protein JJT94_12755, partial [Bernardetiaceae bacterium]|nr:hypothetical protein [Bernardetiaceae bacterium]